MDLRCQYASTVCPNTRSLKISGELHRFCLFHRRSANAAQRRWKQKKLAAATSGGEDGAIGKPIKTTTRRRNPRTDAEIRAQPVATKRRPTSREIAAPRIYQPIASATMNPSLFQLTRPSTAMAMDALPPLFAQDDVSVWSSLAVGVDQHAVPIYSPEDLWWTDAFVQPDGGVIV